MQIIKDKKGFLLGEYTLKVIIAVLSLCLLLYLLASFYSSYQTDKDVNLAKASLKDISEKMSLAMENNIVQKSVLLSPVGAEIKAYQKGQQRPTQCFDNCVCLNFKTGIFSKETVCENFDFPVLIKQDMELPVDVEIKYNGGLFEISKYE